MPQAGSSTSTTIGLFAKLQIAAAKGWRALATRPALACAAVGMAAFLLGCVNFAIDGYPKPRIHDEFSYLLGADTFASGRVANPTHPLWIYFETMHVNQQPTYVSMYPPAQALVLAAGQKLGHPWYGVLASVVAMCMAVYWMLYVWLPRGWALLGGLVVVALTAFSYWTNTYWGGAVAATGGALLIGAFGRIRHRPTPSNSLVLVCGIAILGNSRPYEGAVVAFAVLVALLVWSRSPQSPPLRQQLRRVYIPAAVALVLTGSAMSYYFWRTTGNPLKMPYVVNLETYIYRRMWLWGKNRPEVVYRHEVMRRLYRALLREDLTTREKVRGKLVNILGFYFGKPLVGLLLFVPWIALKDRRFRPLLWFCGAGVCAVAMSEWVHQHYIAPVTGLFVAISIQGLRHLRTWHIRGFAVGTAAVTIVLIGCAYFTIARGRLFARRVARPDWGKARAEMIESWRVSGGKHLVIVRYDSSHNVHDEWVYNAADIDASPVVWAREMSDNGPLLSYFRDRRIWLLEPDGIQVRLTPYPQQLNASIP